MLGADVMAQANLDVKHCETQDAAAKRATSVHRRNMDRACLVAAGVVAVALLGDSRSAWFGPVFGWHAFAASVRRQSANDTVN